MRMKKIFLASALLASIVACGDNSSEGGSMNSDRNTVDTATINGGGALYDSATVDSTAPSGAAGGAITPGAGTSGDTTGR